MAVTIQSVRDLLDNVPSNSVPDDTVQGNIDRSTRFVDSVKDSGADSYDVDDAIRAMSVWLTYGSYSEGIAEQVGAIATALREKFEHYRKVAELFINQVSKEYIDLDLDKLDPTDMPMVGDDPGIYVLTTSEAYSQ